MTLKNEYYKAAKVLEEEGGWQVPELKVVLRPGETSKGRGRGGPGEELATVMSLRALSALRRI